MVLAADVIARLPEYATLKAIGYSNRYLVKTLWDKRMACRFSIPPAVCAALVTVSIDVLLFRD